jgi:hypothetical protein
MQNVNVHERAAYFICMTHAALREGQMDNKLIIINMLAFIKATLLFCTVYEHSVKDLHDDEKKSGLEMKILSRHVLQLHI